MFNLSNGPRPPAVVAYSSPNMAGKSTFIRSIGVNAVLAQCGAPVRAARLRLSPLTVAASICVLDSLSGGVSRFYAEIHRVMQQGGQVIVLGRYQGKGPAEVKLTGVPLWT